MHNAIKRGVLTGTVTGFDDFHNLLYPMPATKKRKEKKEREKYFGLLFSLRIKEKI